MKSKNSKQLDFQPAGHRILVRTLQAENTTPSGIVLTEEDTDRPHEGTIVSDPPGSEFHRGDHVVYSGTRIKIGAEDLLILQLGDILGTLRGKAR